MSREWGIYPDDCQPRQWWGARAIINRGRMELLPDRQNYERNDDVSDVDRDDMFFWMGSEMDSVIRKKVKEGFFKKWEDILIINSETGRFHCEATPKNSGGCYLYIGVWEASK